MEGRRMVKAVLFYKRKRLTSEANKLNFFLRHRLFSIRTLLPYGGERARAGLRLYPGIIILVISPSALGGSSAATFPYPKITTAPQFGVYCEGILRTSVAKRKVSGSET